MYLLKDFSFLQIILTLWFRSIRFWTCRILRPYKLRACDLIFHFVLPPADRGFAMTNLPPNEASQKSHCLRSDSGSEQAIGLHPWQLKKKNNGCLSHKIFVWNKLYVYLCSLCQREDAQWYSAGLRPWWPGVRVPAREGNFFSSPLSPYRLWGLPSLLANGYQGLFLWIKAAGAWSWPLTSISVEVKNEWSYNSTPSIRFQGVMLS
jgi:hypothetical protein